MVGPVTLTWQGQRGGRFDLTPHCYYHCLLMRERAAGRAAVCSRRTADGGDGSGRREHDDSEQLSWHERGRADAAS